MLCRQLVHIRQLLQAGESKVRHKGIQEAVCHLAQRYCR